MVCHPKTRAYVRLLGPCFKTGRLRPFRQHPKRASTFTKHEPPPSTTLHAVPPSTAKHPHINPPSGSRCDSLSPPGRAEQRLTTARGRLPPATLSPTRQTDADPPRRQMHRAHLQSQKRHPCGVVALDSPDARLITAEALLPSIGSLLTISRAFNSLFKVLFIFPSQYLFAIGLVPIFSFR